MGKGGGGWGVSTEWGREEGDREGVGGVSTEWGREEGVGE